MYNQFQDIEVQADRFEQENILNQCNLEESEVDQETANDLNFLIRLREQKEFLWKFHPNNPERGDVECQYNILENFIENLENKLGI